MTNGDEFVHALQQLGVACGTWFSNLGDNPPPEPLDYGYCALPDGTSLFIVIERTPAELDAFLQIAEQKGCAVPGAPPTSDYIRGERWVIQSEQGGSLDGVAAQIGLPLSTFKCGG